jgi:hypothetical protein
MMNSNLSKFGNNVDMENYGLLHSTSLKRNLVLEIQFVHSIDVCDRGQI